MKDNPIGWKFTFGSYKLNDDKATIDPKLAEHHRKRIERNQLKALKPPTGKSSKWK